jgi:hypothetical protein
MGAHHHENRRALFPCLDDSFGDPVYGRMPKAGFVGCGIKHDGKVKVVDTV